MADEPKKSETTESKESPPSSIPLTGENVNNTVDSQSGTDSTTEENKAGFNTQPTIVQKEKKGWKRAELISLCALLVAVIALILNKCSLDNTTRSVNITDSTFKRNNIKDSLNAISQRGRDSVNRIKDSLTIELAQQSLGTQKASLKQNAQQFEEESRPYVSFIGVKLDSVLNKAGKKELRPIIISKNNGRSPGIMISIHTGSVLEISDRLEQIPAYNKGGETMQIFPPNQEVPISVAGNPITPEITNALVKGVFYLYVYGEITYTDVFNKHIYQTTHCFRCEGKGGKFGWDYYKHPYDKMIIIK